MKRSFLQKKRYERGFLQGNAAFCRKTLRKGHSARKRSFLQKNATKGAFCKETQLSAEKRYERGFLQRNPAFCRKTRGLTCGLTCVLTYGLTCGLTCGLSCGGPAV
jgi:hypothetical protein